MCDDEVGRVSADAVRAIAKAAELFVGALAARALEAAQAGKRKNFKAADVAALAARDRWGRWRRGGVPRRAARGCRDVAAGSCDWSCCWLCPPTRHPPHAPTCQPNLTRRRLADMGLREVLEEALSGGGGGGEQENAAAAAAAKDDKRRAAKRAKQEEAAAGSRQITSFFAAPAPAAQQAEVEAGGA